MLSGRHFLLLGALASAGLVSVRDGQKQVKLGYEIANVETRLRNTREAVVRARARLLSIRTPARALERAARLDLEVGPPSDLALYLTTPDAGRSEDTLLGNDWMPGPAGEARGRRDGLGGVPGHREYGNRGTPAER
jgi:hypothetical protein